VSDLVACVDFGSTFTKALLVDTATAELVATAEAPTTIGSDLLEGWGTCRDRLAESAPAARRAPVLACSSAGGGLRIAVVGNEELVTAEAGRRVALSSGGRVVHVAVGGLAHDGLPQLAASAPDVVLLVGGTDGGNSEVLLAAAQCLADAPWPGPVVVAGNAHAAAEVSGLLAAAGVDADAVANVVPQIGVLQPDPARGAIRAMFLRHVIGGKHLSASTEFAAMVTGPTPDIVLTAVELLAESEGDVAVVDVGGATTDVYSVVALDPHDDGLAPQVVAATPVNRTVEGDLGMRWSAESTVESALGAGLVAASEAPGLTAGAVRRAGDVRLVPADAPDADLDLRLAELAAEMALRRHAGRQRVAFGPDGRLVERSGTDLREVQLLVGSGGVLRHSVASRAEQVLRRCTGADVEGGWLLPRAPRLVVDSSYALVAAGLLRRHHFEAARVLLRDHVARSGAG